MQQPKIRLGSAHQSHTHLLSLVIFFCLALATGAYSQDVSFLKFIADTLVISVPADSAGTVTGTSLPVLDSRESPGPMLGIRQIKKWGYIPVDQYLVLAEPLAAALGKRLPTVTTRPGTALVIDHISLWYDGSPMFLKGWALNGYTRLVDGAEATLRDWQWERRAKKKWKQKPEDTIGQLIEEWMSAQAKALTDARLGRGFSSHNYRRQLMFRVNTIILPDGYMVDGRLSLDFPADQLDRYIRGAPGMNIYYRKSSLHESVAIGGQGQRWLFRLWPSWLGNLDLSLRIGGNSYNPDKFDYIDWWNILLVNVGLTAAVEYHPRYYKGLFAGIGLHHSINILPLLDVVPPFATGLLLTVGVILP